MPRKQISALLAVLLLFSGCSSREKEIIEEKPVQQIQQPPVVSTPQPEEKPEEKPVEEVQEVDIDLTPFNNNMMYAEVMNMTQSPEEYNGKTVRLRGEFSRYSDMDENGQPIPDSEHLLCIVFDTMGCCAQGVELILKEVPARFPDEEQEVTVHGICNIYMDEYEFTVFELKEAVIE